MSAQNVILMAETKDITLSASRIKLLNSCSLKYWFRYVQKLPDQKNLGSTIGTICHQVCQTLCNKDKYYDYVNNIIKTHKYDAAMLKYMAVLLTKHGVFSADNLTKIKKYVGVALTNDFFIEGGKLQKPETFFEIEEPFKAKGYIDSYAIFKDETDSWAEIHDLKSAKTQFSAKELEENIQAYIYLLAVKKMHPEINLNKSLVKFVFLQYPDDPIQTVQGNVSVLNGITSYLKYIQKYMEDFTEIHSRANIAADITPKKEDGFCGKLMCGFAKKLGQKKKDGGAMFHCPYKFARDYWAVLDEKDNVVYSSFDEIQLKELKEGQKLIKKRHEGCPAFLHFGNSGDFDSF